MIAEQKLADRFDRYLVVTSGQPIIHAVGTGFRKDMISSATMSRSPAPSPRSWAWSRNNVESDWDSLFAESDAGRYDMVCNGVEVTDEAL